MKQIASFKIFIGLYALLACTGIAAGQNLIVNGDAEQSPYDTIPAGWTNIQGSWTGYDASGDDITAESGTHYFYEGEDSLGILQQDVDVAAYASSIDASTQQFLFRGYVQAFDQDPADQSRIKVQCLGNANNVLYNFDSDTISFIGGWKQVADTFIAPAGTRSIRIQLISTRRNGSANDGYYDNLSLSAQSATGIRTIASRAIPLSLIPNPNNGTFSMDAEVDAGSSYVISITDMTGRMIYLDKFKAVSSSIHKVVELNAVAKGIYFLHLSNAVDNRQTVSKISIQ